MSKKEGIRFSKIIVFFVIVSCVLFSASVLFIHYKNGTEPAVLIGAFFGTMVTELLALARMKLNEDSQNINKIQEKENNEKVNLIEKTNNGGK